MKANELMIGDWVDVRNNAESNAPHPERITPSHLLRDEHWYGIELLPEILEKNGIKRLVIQTSEVTYCCNTPYISCTFLKPLKYWVVEVGPVGSKKYPYTISSGIKYIHQLQHILRDTGIDKEITI